MAMTKQEKLDRKAEQKYEQTHQRRYRMTTSDWIFEILNNEYFLSFKGL